MENRQLILDSGATKTAWALVQRANVLQEGQVAGLNPYLNSSDRLSAIIKELHSAIQHSVQQLYFYGSGCRALDCKALIHSLISQYFLDSHIEIEDDITGVAKALCGNKTGIACILGTGASSGLYNGDIIIQYAPSNGIWLGDEGSGAYLGKQLIKAYLDEELPKDLRASFEKEFPDRRAYILRQVYGQESPSAYLGHFTPFIKDNQQHSFIAKLLQQSFTEFFRRFAQYKPLWKKYPVYIGGSTAHHFSNILHSVAKNQGIRIAEISQGVMEGLISYHRGIKA